MTKRMRIPVPRGSLRSNELDLLIADDLGRLMHAAYPDGLPMPEEKILQGRALALRLQDAGVNCEIYVTGRTRNGTGMIHLEQTAYAIRFD